MKLPLNIAQQFTQLPKNIEDVVRILASRVGEVESYSSLSKKYENIVIATIEKKKEHPDAEKLDIYQISIGDKNLIEVVAGDKTLEIGNKVAYIKPKGIVPSTFDTSKPFVISSIKMRGVMSNGMMCSEKELDIGSDHKHVLKLPQDAPVGENFANYYELNDTVIELENKALTNRGDLFGILGLAREISGAQGIKFDSPDWYKKAQIKLEPSEVCLNFDVDNQAESLCQRYCAIAMSGVKITESPIWLKSALIKSDIKPINNLVDITNYIMILTGQPIHAFDFDKVMKYDTTQADMGHIVIRTAKEKEKIHTLDGNIYNLSNKNLIIANSQHPIAIAGMIGGVDTQIDENTKNIILESANFDRYNLRRSSMELGIITESSTRFTRSRSPDMCLPILSHTVELITELCNGQIASTLIDLYPLKRNKKQITININKLNMKLGLNITSEELIKLLENIEYKHTGLKDKYITFEVPSFRQDLEIEEDVYEDVVRIYGYEKITPILPQKPINASSLPKMILLKREIREILSNSGCNELLTYNFVSMNLLKDVNQDPNICLKLKNPLSKDLELMRPSILVSLLDKATVNIQEGINSFGIFELGISHQKDNLNEEKLPLEEWKLGFVFSDSTNSLQGSPYYQAKRYLEKILNTVNIKNLNYELVVDIDYESTPIWVKVLLDTFESNSSAIVSTVIGKTKVILGVIGEINNQVKQTLSLNDFTTAFEINLESILQTKSNVKKCLKTSKFPYITQDICFVVPDKVMYAELLHIINKAINKKNIQSNIKCIDIFKKEGSTTRNITVKISLTDTTKTLKDKDYQKIREKISKRVAKIDISM
ncbi:TPA: phenylalanine--tRNA ligase subunit beta [Patescibacteria group bacterium]|nr:phenylalanine--tRNA ligase subunit beta [Patescibacteria group bacterium]